MKRPIEQLEKIKVKEEVAMDDDLNLGSWLDEMGIKIANPEECCNQLNGKFIATGYDGYNYFEYERYETEAEYQSRQTIYKEQLAFYEEWAEKDRIEREATNKKKLEKINAQLADLAQQKAYLESNLRRFSS